MSIWLLIINRVQHGRQLFNFLHWTMEFHNQNLLENFAKNNWSTMSFTVKTPIHLFLALQFLKNISHILGLHQHKLFWSVLVSLTPATEAYKSTWIHGWKILKKNAKELSKCYSNLWTPSTVLVLIILK